MTNGADFSAVFLFFEGCFRFFCRGLQRPHISLIAPRKNARPPLVIPLAPPHTVGMNRERGYTLIETLAAVALVLILSATGLYGWRSWQQEQRLWQTASALRDYLIYLRNDANWHNRDRRLRVNRTAQRWCLTADDAVLEGCPAGNPAVFQPEWEEVSLSKMTPNLAFFGLRNTAWAGSLAIASEAGRWTVVVSNWGRIRLCEEGAC